jgi:hypothetical protein
VGWFGYDTGVRAWFETNKGDDDSIPLYKAPPQRQWVGLTDEDLKFWTNELGQGELGRGVIRAVADHLKEKNT